MHISMRGDTICYGPVMGGLDERADAQSVTFARTETSTPSVAHAGQAARHRPSLQQQWREQREAALAAKDRLDSAAASSTEAVAVAFERQGDMPADGFVGWVRPRLERIQLFRGDPHAPIGSFKWRPVVLRRNEEQAKRDLYQLCESGTLFPKGAVYETKFLPAGQAPLAIEQPLQQWDLPRHFDHARAWNE